MHRVNYERLTMWLEQVCESPAYPDNQNRVNVVFSYIYVALQKAVTDWEKTLWNINGTATGRPFMGWFLESCDPINAKNNESSLVNE
jgi:hypothetical protein